MHPSIALRLLAVFLLAAPAGAAIAESTGDKQAATQAQPCLDQSQATLLVLHFRSGGDPESNLYAAGFAQALADRLYCARAPITQQYCPYETADQCPSSGLGSLDPITDAAALKAAKALAVRYFVTGELALNAEEVRIAAKLRRADDQAGDVPIELTCKVADLPSAQTELALRIAQAMELKLTEAQTAALQKPNFSNPKVLILYGRSVAAGSRQEAADRLWEAVDADPKSDFAAIRIAELSLYRGCDYEEMTQGSRLAQLLDRVGPDPHRRLLRGQLSLCRCEYREAEGYLKSSTASYPTMCRQHQALAHVAICRQDADLAIAEARALVSLWSGSALHHAILAKAHQVAAGNARRCHFPEDMTPEMESKWLEHTQECFREGCLAVQMNPDCTLGWSTVASASLQLGRDEKMRQALAELKRINPKNLGTYLKAIASALPQWGGTEQDRAAIIADVEKAFGKESYEVDIARCVLASMSYGRKTEDWNEILRLADDAVRKSNGESSEALMWKCKAMYNCENWKDLSQELLELAKKGFEKWRCLDWRFMLGRAHVRRMLALPQEQRKMRMLVDALQHFMLYRDEIPFDEDGPRLVGYCFHLSGMTKEAEQEYRRTLELDPTNKWTKEQLAKLLGSGETLSGD